jgi:hypothetical protein
VAQHVGRLRCDELFGLGDVPFGGVPLLELLGLFGGEPVQVDELVDVVGVAHAAAGGPSFVDDRHGGTVGLGLADVVPVDWRTEDGVGLLLGAHDDRCAGEPDPGGVGQCPLQCGVQRAVV